MPITDRQRELRKNHLGSSDAAAILGLSPWKSPLDVFLEKTRDVEELAPTPAMEIGNALEDAIISWSLKQLGHPESRRNQRRVHRNGIMAANLDCQILDAGGAIPLEVKFSNQPSEWGPESDGFDGVPQQYATQVLHQMACIGASRAFLGVFIAGFRAEFRMYEFRGVDEHLHGLEQFEERWWEQHVQRGIAPAESEPASLDVLARVVRTEGKSIVLPDDLVATWREADAAKKAAEETCDAAKSAVLMALGDAEEATCGLGSITYRKQTSRTIDSTRLKAERADIAELYTKVNEFRVCRFSAPKAAKAGKAKVGA